MQFNLGKLKFRWAGNNTYTAVLLLVLYTVATNHHWIQPRADLEVILWGYLGVALRAGMKRDAKTTVRAIKEVPAATVVAAKKEEADGHSGNP